MPEIKYLFRYRDMVASTLVEHQKIIEKNGACWWGWWKRPAETIRFEIWAELADQTGRGEPVMVGLFDSGAGTVRIARVIDIVVSRSPGDKSDTHPAVPEDEKGLVPKYYRKSSFSHAWLKLDLIQMDDLDFFGRYSFSSVPKLPNYSEAVLSMLTNKVVLDANELRGMDTTIWNIRPRIDSDNDEKVLLSTQGLTEAISNEPLYANSQFILHLTDAHFAVDKFRDQHIWRLDGEDDNEGFSLVESISGALADQSVGIIVITGDFTFIGSPEEFELAASSVNKLLGAFDLGVENLVMIPGNHDIKWTREDAYEDDAKVAVASAEATTNYRDFYERVYRHNAHKGLAMGRRYLMPNGMAVEICGVNSSSLETGKNFLAGIGRVQEKTFEEVSRELGWQEESTLALRILALHHHLSLTENLEPYADAPRGFGIAVDAPRIQRLAAQKGVQLVLHGHKHRAFIWRSGVYELPEHTNTKYRLGDLSIVGGGSVGSSETEGNRNYFNILDVSPSGIELTIFRGENGGTFSAMQKWDAEFSIAGEPKRLLLGEWTRQEEKLG